MCEREAYTSAVSRQSERKKQAKRVHAHIPARHDAIGRPVRDRDAASRIYYVVVVLENIKEEKAEGDDRAEEGIRAGEQG